MNSNSTSWQVGMMHWVIKEKLNHYYKWIKNKNEEKREKEKVLGTYNKQYKQRCCKCGNYGHKPGDCKCLENKKERKSDEKMTTKGNILRVCYQCRKNGHMRKDCHERKSKEKKKWKAEKVVEVMMMS